MLQLVTIEEASSYCRRTTTDDDVEFVILVQAASQSVANHLASGDSYLDYLTSDLEAQDVDSEGVALNVPPVVKAATLFMAGWLFRHRDEDDQKAFPEGYLPYPVRALLGPLRNHVMA